MREFNPAVTVPAPRRIRAPVPSQEAKDAAGIRAFFFSARVAYLDCLPTTHGCVVNRRGPSILRMHSAVCRRFTPCPTPTTCRRIVEMAFEACILCQTTPSHARPLRRDVIQQKGDVTGELKMTATFILTHTRPHTLLLWCCTIFLTCPHMKPSRWAPGIVCCG